MIGLNNVEERRGEDATGQVDPAADLIGSLAPASAWVSVDVSTQTIIAEAGAVDQRLRHVAVDQVRAARRTNGLRKIRARAGFADLVAVSLELPGQRARVVTLARLVGEAPFGAAVLSAVRSKIHALRSRKQPRTEPDAAASMASIRRRAPVSAFIVDRNLAVICASLRDTQADLGRTGQRAPGRSRDRLPVLIERIVRDALEAWPDEFAPDSSEMVVPVGTMVVRIVPMRGFVGDHIGVFTERARSAAHIDALARRYQISSRELEVARLLIKGLSADEVGMRLGIAETTVAAHVRSIIGKTKSHNRTEAIAKLLGR
jgi:DNA-binding CsgD family transcriptional regulator